MGVPLPKVKNQIQMCEQAIARTESNIDYLNLRGARGYPKKHFSKASLIESEHEVLNKLQDRLKVLRKEYEARYANLA